VLAVAKDSRYANPLSQPSWTPVPLEKLNHAELQRMHHKCDYYATHSQDSRAGEPDISQCREGGVPVRGVLPAA
jgi:hypothetical protein